MVRCPKIAHRIVTAASPSNRVMVGIHVLERNPQMANLTAFPVSGIDGLAPNLPIFLSKKLFSGMSDVAKFILESGERRRFPIDLMRFPTQRASSVPRASTKYSDIRDTSAAYRRHIRAGRIGYIPSRAKAGE